MLCYYYVLYYFATKSERNQTKMYKCSIWSVLREKVYRFRIADVDELKTRLIDE